MSCRVNRRDAGGGSANETNTATGGENDYADDNVNLGKAALGGEKNNST